MLIDSFEKLQHCLLSLDTDTIIACDLEASKLDTRIAEIEGIGFGTSDQQFFIPFPSSISFTDLILFLEKLFQKTVIFHNAKYDIKLLLYNKFPVPLKIHDTMIMSWLVDENNTHGLKPLVESIFGRAPKKWNELNKTTDLFRTQEDVTEELAKYCCEDVKNTYDLYQYFLPLLKKEELDIDYERIEIKLIPVLIAMEMRGIKVDVSWLQQKQEEAKKELWKLEKAIVTKAKEKDPNSQLNIRSTKQLDYLLYDVFQYKAGKETATGKRSTDSESLERIIREEKLQETDIVPMLLKFRDLDKVHGTYLVALAQQAGTENVIHTNFMQHGTRTGRLASNDPNMQNIPSRHDLWNVRSAFIAREGYTFLMCDYSQIELRMMAHFSQDDHMVETFNTNGDIHAETMKATGATRHVSKGISFGLIYGMGPRTLAQTLHIPEDDAKRYIRKFFGRYPKVKYFIEAVQTRTLRSGYVTMITGRRRHFHEIADRRWYATIARQAINTKMQGSAADLIKIAMIALQPLLTTLGAFPLIQIHDEIIIETPLDKVEETKKIVKKIMENTIKLKVPVVVNIVEGVRWTKE